MSDPRFPHDPDLEFLRDRELLELARLLRGRRLQEPPIDPAFRSSLRRDLRRKHYELLEPSTSWWRRLTSGPGLAWTGATAGAVAIAVALVFALRPLPISNTTFVSSPLDHMRNVAVVQPMKLTFQTAMDQQSVESSLQIEPSTQVTYSWVGNTLYVQPVAGQLAPNTQYRLTLAPTATTSSGRHLQQPATITFVTGTTAPTPTAPPVSPSPAQPGVALAGQVQVAPAGSVTPAWSPDGQTIYFAGADGTIESAPLAGGTPQSLGVSGVKVISASPDGTALAVATADAIITLQRDGTGLQDFQVPGALALGWRAGKLYAALPAGVFEVRKGVEQHPATPLAVAAQQAAFAPDGGSLLYLDTIGRVHLVDVQSGHDTAWPVGVTSLPSWSGDGARVAYAGLDGLSLAAPDGTAAATIASLPQLGATSAQGMSVAWSDGAVLAAGPAGLSGVDTTLRTPVRLTPGAFTAISASPKAASIAYVEAGELWTASVQHPGVQPQVESQAAAALKAFMDARMAGDAGTAQKLLAGPAAQEFKQARLLFPGRPRLARWFSVFEQARPDGSVLEVVRLVLADSQDIEVQQLDETLTLRADAGGAFSIVDASQTPDRAVDAGPEVVGIQASGDQVTVTFDSDLKPATAAGITLDGATPSYANRVATFALSGVQPGDVLTLTIPASVEDLGGRSASQPLTVQIVVPSA